jgi:stage II sporulation protein D
MFLRALITAVLLLGYVPNAHAADNWNNMWKQVKTTFGFNEKIKEPSIKVLLIPQADAVILDVKGGYNIYNPLNGERISTRFLGKSHVIEAKREGLKWGEEFPGIFQVALMPDDKFTTVLINGVEYKGAMYIYQIDDGTLSVVNDVPIEDFLKSTLALEFEEALSPEAMAAVAITARTDAFYYVQKAKSTFWHVTLRDINYQGYSVTMRDNGVDNAVDATKNLVLNHLVDGNQTPFPTAWTQHSAGKTAGYSTIYRTYVPGPSGGVVAPLAALNREKTAWESAVARDDLALAAGLTKVTDLEIFRDQNSGKVYGLRLHDGEKKFDMDFLALQKAVGKDLLRSSDFTTSIAGSEVRFNGYGSGAGVGLCLYSANVMAQEGKDAGKILTTFFPETQMDLIPTEKTE